jgi:hypothetical protein
MFQTNPAKIFMGDTGSMFLGLVLAVSAVETSLKSSTTVAIVVPIIVLGLPIADTLLAMWRRGVRGAPLFQADRGHIHHRLLDAGLSQRAASLVLWGASLVLGLAALALTFASGRSAALILLAVGLVAAAILRRIGLIQFERAGGVLEIRRKNLGRRAALHGVAEWPEGGGPRRRVGGGRDLRARSRRFDPDREDRARRPAANDEISVEVIDAFLKACARGGRRVQAEWQTMRLPIELPVTSVPCSPSCRGVPKVTFRSH